MEPVIIAGSSSDDEGHHHHASDSPPASDVEAGAGSPVRRTSSLIHSPGGLQQPTAVSSSTSRAATQRHLRHLQQQQQQQQQLLHNGATASVNISQQALLHGKGLSVGGGGLGGSSSSTTAPLLVARVSDSLAKLWVRLWRRSSQPHRLSDPHRQPHHHRRSQAHGAPRVPRTLLLFGLALLVLLPTVVLLRVSIPHHSSSSSPSSSRGSSSGWLRRGALLDGPGAGPSDASAAAEAALMRDMEHAASAPADVDNSSGQVSAFQGPADAAVSAAAAAPCIPPSRATPWEVALAAAAGGSGAGATTSSSSQQDTQAYEEPQATDTDSQQQDMLLGMKQQQQQDAAQQAVGRHLFLLSAAPAAERSRHLQQQQQQDSSKQHPSARLVAAAALSVAGGNVSLAKSLLDDKVMVQQLWAGIYQAQSTQAQQQKLLVEAAASRSEAGGDDVGAVDEEAAAGAAEAWTDVDAAAAGGIAGGAGSNSGGAAAEAAAGGDTAEFFDAEAAADPAVPLPPLLDGSTSSSSGSGPAPALAAATATVASSPAAAAAGPQPAAASPAAAAAGGALRVSLVNDVEFHHEVTLGLMAALQQHRDNLQVYLHASVFKPKPGGVGDTAFNLRSYVNRVMPGTKLRDAHDKASISETDVAIFVSPEFSIPYYRSFLERSRPRLVVVFIHEPNMALSRLQYIINMHPLVGVATLAPHVSGLVRLRMRMDWVHWMMPTAPVDCANTCWEGFAVQGKFESSRRSYAVLWSAMQQQQQAAAQRQLLAQRDQQQQQQLQPAVAQLSSSSVVSHASRLLSHLRLNTLPALQQQLLRWWRTRAASAHSSSTPASSQISSSVGGPVRALQQSLAPAASAALPLINVLGSGDVRQLGVAPELRPAVRLYLNQGYEDYYDALCRSLALLPLFNASSGYLNDKISSSVLASVATGTPMLVPRAFLNVFTEFKEEHVLLLEEDNAGDAAAAGAALMKQLSALSSPQSAELLQAKRKALQRLRFVLNHQAAAKLDGLIAAASGKPHAGPKQA